MIALAVPVSLKKEASQARDSMATSQTALYHHRAARPDPWLRKSSLLRMTIQDDSLPFLAV